MSEAASPTGVSSTGMVVPITQVGALSQAWYDALGYEFRKPQKAAPVKTMKTVDALNGRSGDAVVHLVDAAYWLKGCSSLGNLRYAGRHEVGYLGHCRCHDLADAA